MSVLSADISIATINETLKQQINSFEILSRLDIIDLYLVRKTEEFLSHAILKYQSTAEQIKHEL